ncbi:MAG: methyltransferase domain-containing protein [Planctomycetota bacterium]
MRRQRDIDEEMDAPGVDPVKLRQSLIFIRRINTALRYNAATAKAVRELGGGSVLDICCGSADFAEHVDGPFTGLDFHAKTLAVARQWQPKATLVRGEAMALPFDDGSFDVVVCQMALHHFDTADAKTIITEMERVSRRGWVVADLLRRRRASGWIWLFTAFASPMVKHDARVSVRQAFSEVEAKQLAADTGSAYCPAFGHRFLLVRDKRRDRLL